MIEPMAAVTQEMKRVMNQAELATVTRDDATTDVVAEIEMQMRFVALAVAIMRKRHIGDKLSTKDFEILVEYEINNWHRGSR